MCRLLRSLLFSPCFSVLMATLNMRGYFKLFVVRKGSGLGWLGFEELLLVIFVYSSYLKGQRCLVVSCLEYCFKFLLVKRYFELFEDVCSS